VGLEDILATLRADSEEEIAQEAARAEVAIAAILHAAHEEAERVESAAASARDSRLAAEAEVLRSRARLNVERRLRETREALYQEVLSRARDRLERHRLDVGYRDTVRALLAECLAFLPEGNVVLADPRDADLVRDVMADLGVTAELQTSLETWGGIDLGNGAGAVVRNTLEQRFDRAGVELRRRVGDLVPGLRGADPV
jgi:vacuolar-type H+-ATPase subunit E/Vma4